MTAVQPRVRHPRPSRPPRRRPRLRSWWKDSLEAIAWLSGVGAIALMLASGTADFTTVAGASTSLGRVTGIVASTLIMIQLLLISRAPFVERVVGHDRALAAHGRLGRIGFFAMLAHAVLITVGYSAVDGSGVLREALDLTLHFGGPMTAAVGGFALLCLVIVTSLALVRSRWRYENWHAVHLFSYAAIVLTIPHQFLNGSTFATSSAAWWYWAALWLLAVGALIGYRLVRPAWLLVRHDLRVASVSRLADGSTVIAMRGRGLERLSPRAGQFFLFRFLQRDLWDEAHPYSMSRARSGDWIRITVKPLGDHSTAMAGLCVGTRVAIEGPLGVFHDRARSGRHLVLAGAGIGIAPVLAMLEDTDFAPGECTVIVRARDALEAPHLDEVRAIADARGAKVVTVFGPRGFGWSSVDTPVSLRSLVPTLDDADVYACGPVRWLESLRTDAESLGLKADAFHSELFTW